jgi:hypothetical protein
MRLISVSILFICLVAVTFSNCLIVFAYEINRQYISKEICINKTNPAAHCNGHCYLSKQLAKEEKPSSPLNTKGSEKFEIQLFCVELASSFLNIKTTEKPFCSQKQNFTVQQFIHSSFHPPQA